MASPLSPPPSCCPLLCQSPSVSVAPVVPAEASRRVIFHQRRCPRRQLPAAPAHPFHRIPCSQHLLLQPPQLARHTPRHLILDNQHPGHPLRHQRLPRPAPGGPPPLHHLLGQLDPQPRPAPRSRRDRGAPASPASPLRHRRRPRLGRHAVASVRKAVHAANAPGDPFARPPAQPLRVLTVFSRLTRHRIRQPRELAPVAQPLARHARLPHPESACAVRIP